MTSLNSDYTLPRNVIDHTPTQSNVKDTLKSTSLNRPHWTYTEV